MYIYGIVQPGTWLDLTGTQEQVREVSLLLDLLINEFFYANHALHLFLTTKYEKPEYCTSSEILERMQISQQLRAKPELLAITNDQEREKQILLETDIMIKQKKWQAGKAPNIFCHHRPHIYANAFIYHLDLFDKYFKVLAENPIAPAGLKGLYAQFLKDFPSLRGIRNTTQHKEDRVRKLDRNGYPLSLQPVDNSLVKAPSGALVLDGLNLSTGEFVTTLNDGSCGKILISPKTMENLQTILHAILNAYNWTGPQTYFPS